MTWKHWKTVILIQIQKKHLWLDASFDWIKCLKILSTLEWCSKSQKFSVKKAHFQSNKTQFSSKNDTIFSQKIPFQSKKTFWAKRHFSSQKDTIFSEKSSHFQWKKFPFSVKNDREDCLADDLTQTDVQKITSSKVNSKLELEWKKPHASSGQPHRIKKR